MSMNEFPRTYQYVILHGKGRDFADGIKWRSLNRKITLIIEVGQM